MRRLITALLTLAFLGQTSHPSWAQDWSFLGPLTQQTLDVRPGDSAPTLFSDHPDPATARFSLIFHYFDSRSGGNSFGLNVGLYRHDPEGWRFLTLLEIFGVEPRDAQFFPGRIVVTTTMPGPNDPRCCPTVPTRWDIDTRTFQITRTP